MKFFRDLCDFIKNVAHDGRIPEKDKKIILGLLALILSPVDLIPDWIPIFGQLDDLIALSIILDYFFQVLDDRILLSHWPWDLKNFVRVRSIARFLQFLVPRFVKKKLWTYVGDPY